jgi:hypothetical protein
MGKSAWQEAKMQHTIYIADELVLEAHPDGPHILLRREGEPGSVRVYLHKVRYLADALCSMTGEMAGVIVGDGDSKEQE